MSRKIALFVVGVSLAAPSLSSAPPLFATPSAWAQENSASENVPGPGRTDPNAAPGEPGQLPVDDRPGMLQNVVTGAASGYVYNNFFNRENLDRGLGILAAILLAAVVLGYWAYQSARAELRGYAATSRRMWTGFRGRFNRGRFDDAHARGHATNARGFTSAPGTRTTTATPPPFRDASTVDDEAASRVSSGVHRYDEPDVNRGFDRDRRIDENDVDRRAG